MSIDLKANRPTSDDELRAIQKATYNLACKGEYEEALDICNWLIASKSTEAAGFRQRAAVKEHMSDIGGAIDDLRVAIAQSDEEPADFHALGLLLLESGSTIDAIVAFEKAICIGEKLDDGYYMNSSLLFKAEAHLRRANYAEALADVVRLPNGYRAHVSGVGMRTKEQIEAEAKAAMIQKG